MVGKNVRIRWVMGKTCGDGTASRAGGRVIVILWEEFLCDQMACGTYPGKHMESKSVNHGKLITSNICIWSQQSFKGITTMCLHG